MRNRLLAIALALGFCVALTAQASADQVGGDSQHGYFSEHAVVTGTVTGVSATSFTADAYVVMPGDGGPSATPTTTSVTITPGTSTKLIVNGQPASGVSSIQNGDTFYAVYEGVSSSTDISVITSGTPDYVTAFLPPTPTFVVRGIITAAPTAANPDQFTATAAIVEPCGHSGHGYGRYRHRLDGVGYGYGCRIDGFWMGDKAGGSYGYQPLSAHAHTARAHSHHRGHHHHRGRHHARHHRAHHHHARHHKRGPRNMAAPTTGVTITVDAATKLDVNGNASATAADLAVGQRFVAVFAGSPSTASLTSLPPALSVYAKTVYERYGFIGTVTTINTQTNPNTITINVTDSTPDGFFSGPTTFTVGADTHVVTSSGPSLTGVTVGDTVAGGMIAPPGETATQIESMPLGFLVDRPMWFGDHVAHHTEMNHLRMFLRRHHGRIRD